ncbi:50S ribosomal protein L11 methyltransferase [Parabacteroides distasonis]|nr:50S ribosomal protein L11 methyltransferase [Parabacteroides distasonis]
MMKENRSDLLHTLTERLKAIDYNKLPISDYNKRYIGNLKPALSYFMHIYADCLQRGLQAIQTPISDVTLIDYGGGTGFLSILAKSIGIGQVIYIDLNPSSVETIQLLETNNRNRPRYHTPWRFRCSCGLVRKEQSLPPTFNRYGPDRACL